MRFLLLFLMTLPTFAQDFSHSIPPERYAPIIYYYAAETGIPVYIACGIISEESDWSERAVGRLKGKAYAGGLMMLSFRYHDEFRDKYNGGVEFDEFNAEDSIRIGLRYFAALHRWLGTFRKACNFYATGYPDGVKKWVRLMVSREIGE